MSNQKDYTQYRDANFIANSITSIRQEVVEKYGSVYQIPKPFFEIVNEDYTTSHFAFLPVNLLDDNRIIYQAFTITEDFEGNYTCNPVGEQFCTDEKMEVEETTDSKTKFSLRLHKNLIKVFEF